MSLTPGTRLGPYEIVSALGAGGMGDVYRAKDTKLNHPNIVQIYGFEETTPGVVSEKRLPVSFLIMELVEGQDLSELISGGSYVGRSFSSGAPAASPSAGAAAGTSTLPLTVIVNWPSLLKKKCAWPSGSLSW